MWPRRKDKGTTDPRLPQQGPAAGLPAETGLEAARSGEPSDARLIERTLAGDTEAFGELVVRYQDRLYATLLHWLDSAAIRAREAGTAASQPNS